MKGEEVRQRVGVPVGDVQKQAGLREDCVRCGERAIAVPIHELQVAVRNGVPSHEVRATVKIDVHGANAVSRIQEDAFGMLGESAVTIAK
jgi:hypothetical protein